MSAAAIPVIDFSGVPEGDPASLGRAASEVLAAATATGFFYLSNHGVPPAIIERATSTARAFFALEDAVKQQTRAVDHRGYIGMGDALMEGATKSDYKESFVIGLELGRDDPSVLAGEALRGPNNWPEAMPSFRRDLYAYFEAIGVCGRNLLSVIAISLGQRPDFFADKYRKPLQRTNVIHYPPMPEEREPDQFGGAAHTDYGCITLLWQDQNGGLQILDRRSGDWIEAMPIAGTLVINIADLLARWSNGRFASNLHRVLNRSGRDRYSIATFFDPDFDALVDPRDFGVGPVDARFEPTRAGPYILGRVKRSFDYRIKA